MAKTKDCGTGRLPIAVRLCVLLLATMCVAWAQPLCAQSDALEAARQQLAANPGQASSIANVAGVLLRNIKSADDSEAKLAARKEYLQFLATQAQENPNDAAVLRVFLEGFRAQISSVSDDDAAQADGMLKLLDRSVRGLETTDAAAKAFVEEYRPTFRSLAAEIATAKKRQDLVGKRAFGMDVHAWVNGAPLGLEDIEQKVVLIDFWAVWCGPCIRLFPDIKRWHEEYADDGLVIIGATEYYQYGWNNAKKQSVPDGAPTAQQEQQALLQFAQHYELPQRLAMLAPGSRLKERYVVTGIPQVVLIDRNARISMIRVGAGSRNAKALEAKIEELLAEEPEPVDPKKRRRSRSRSRRR